MIRPTPSFLFVETVMENTVPTDLLSVLIAMTLYRRPFVAPAFTTINEKLGIQSTAALPPNTYPEIGYLIIGNGGHRAVTGTNGLSKNSNYQHETENYALFNQIPYVLRDPADDLTPEERQRFRLRKTVEIDTKSYVAYYGRRLDLANSNIVLEKRTVSPDGKVIDKTPLVPQAKNLSPTPTVLSNTGVNELANVMHYCGIRITISFTAADVQELINVSNILYKDPGYAIISEMGLCSGIEKVVTAATPSGNINYNEVIGCQVMTHISGSTLDMQSFTSGGFNFELYGGSDNPQYQLV